MTSFLEHMKVPSPAVLAQTRVVVDAIAAQVRAETGLSEKQFAKFVKGTEKSLQTSPEELAEEEGGQVLGTLVGAAQTAVREVTGIEDAALVTRLIALMISA